MSNNLAILFESLLAEGKLEDFYLKQREKFPKLIKQIGYLEQNKIPTNYAAWIIKQINVNSPEPVEDIVPLIQSFIKNIGKLDKKDISLYKDTSELHYALEDLNQQKQEKQLQKTTIHSSDIQDVIAQADGWFVTFPHTTEASCNLGTNTTWCTARTQSGNMFLNYVAAKQDAILFYVINPSFNPRKEPFAKMSIGFIKGEPKFNLGDNSLTVDANNKNITQEKFIEVVRPKNANLFLSAMSKKAKELEGVHPAQKEMEIISQDYDLFLKKVASYKDTPQNYEAKKDFFELLKTEYRHNTNSTIKSYVNNFFRELTKASVIARNPNTTPQDLTILSKHLDVSVRIAVAKNPNTKPEVLEVLSTDNDYYVRENLLLNKSTPLQAIINVYGALDEDSYKIVEASKNPNTHPSILNVFAQNKNKKIKLNLANNPNTPSTALTFIAYDEDDIIRKTVAQHPNIKPDDLSELANDHDDFVRVHVARNPNTLPEDLLKMASNQDPEFTLSKEVIAKNPNTHPNVLEILASDPWGDVRYFAKLNPNFPKNLQENKIISNNKLKLLISEMVEESLIGEMPIGKVTRIGDFNKSSSIRNPIDRALLSNPKAEIKMRKIWQNTNGNFDLVFVNDPRVNKSEFKEVGPVNIDFVRNKMKLSEEELSIDPSATTIIYTNNSGDQRVMSSPWILAHRLGHSIARSRERSDNDYLATLWREFTQKLATLFKDLLYNVYDLQPRVRGLTGPNNPFVDDQEVFKLAAQSLGTMKSARENKLRSWYEFAYELFTQYLLYGKIKLNQLPDSVLTKVRGFVKQSKRAYDKSSQDMYNRHDLAYYAEELESTLDYLIEELAGTIFVM